MLHSPLPSKPGERIIEGQLYGASLSLAIISAAKAANGFFLVITPDASKSKLIENELRFFSEENLSILTFPDWEMLPYDHFSPHPDIISERLSTLYQLPRLKKGILLVSISTLMHRLPPRDYLEANSFSIHRGQSLEIALFREELQKSGYHCVSQVMEHGEYAVRGSLLDIFPMGSVVPYRIDLLDDEVDSVRSFDPETQRTIKVMSEVRLLPAHEFPLTQEGITHFRQHWREHFSPNPLNCSLYQNISRAESAAGVEYYLPLFFEHTHTLFDYLSKSTLIITVEDIYAPSRSFWAEVNERYEQLRHDINRPILPPIDLFQPVEQIFGAIKNFPQLQLQSSGIENNSQNTVKNPPNFQINHKSEQPLHLLASWLSTYQGRVLFCAETEGRQEVLESLLNQINVHLKRYDSWHSFLSDSGPLGICVASLEEGLYLEEPAIVIITEFQLFEQQVMQRRLRKNRGDIGTIVRDLTELKMGSPVVHIDHGVGRYMGLETIKTGDIEGEYLTLEYAGSAKLYVPIASLHLISRYTGSDAEHAPLHKLGSGQWEKIKRKATEKIRDVAAELLNIYARRAAQTGFSFKEPDEHYMAFKASFPFEETPDQQQAIAQIITDMTSSRCMDRLVCGDVGFGKTEVAIRAAFLAVQSHKQVMVLVPTTLLAEQHLHTFQDRFAKWPVRIEALSRFRSVKEQTQILENIKNNKIDIIIGTHKLLQSNIQPQSLGLLIVDEEHRFGVKQKERIKALRAEVDLLTLTATPIPRTLNMALTEIRDLSMISTPPAKRLSVKTFVREYQKPLIREAVLRETLRGGQVYYLHNEVQTIERIAEELMDLLPEAKIAIAHGQMRESALERIMADFYHQRFNVLLCTTIIESGIDIPTANTIIINRADRFGLAQLHQLRGRVGRSHHQAYAYLLTPPEQALSSDAKKRLTAIELLEDLGSGFMLATQDLEIRGAGELLGEGQSGHIHELGFSLYMELLEETVKDLKAGKDPLLDKPLHSRTEIDLKIPALIPDNYLPDVHARLVLYKRIANAKDAVELNDLRAEIVDRFGTLLPPIINLFHLAKLKLIAESMRIHKIHVIAEEGVIEFLPEPRLNMEKLIELIQKEPCSYRFVGGQKLRFAMKSKIPEERIKLVETLLARLM